MAELKPTDSELAAFGQREFEALLTEAEVTDYEATQNTLWGPRRRMALATLMRSKTWTSPAFVDINQLPVRSCSNASGLIWSI